MIKESANPCRTDSGGDSPFGGSNDKQDRQETRRPAKAVPLALTASPTDTMQALAATYVDFALDNTALWSAVFNHRLPAGSEVPDWHKADYPVLIAEIIAPLSLLRPDLPPDALQLRAQTLFASVHGVVQLAIHGRFVGAPLSMLKSEVAALVDAMTRGIHLVEA
ncbi:hypothetical protein GQR58_030623 [Nymphon striatum]|nr:hypothetical protein GQR58_030623 [Nymphon striatum]